MPSILVMCHWEKTAVLMVKPRPYLYRLAKAIIESLGDKVPEIARRRVEIERQEKSVNHLKQQSESWAADSDLREREFDAWRVQLESLDRHLALIATLDPSLISRSRDGLKQLLSATSTVSSSELSGSLQTLDRRVIDATEDIPLRRRIHRKIVKVVAKLESDDPLPGLDRQDPFIGKFQSARAELREARSVLSRQQANLGLANTITATYQSLFGTTEPTDEPGNGGLAGWTLRTIKSDT
jgi:hypothetical protein